MLLVYTDTINARIKFIFNVILESIAGFEIRFTSDAAEFAAYSLPKLNYSSQPFHDELYIKPATLLFEKGVKKFDIPTFNWDNYKVFFSTNPASFLPFDIFAASFYLVTRYEEYLPFHGDRFHRFIPFESFAYKNSFLHEPIVNIWTEILREKIVERYPGFKAAGRKFTFLSTIDVDNAYAYLHKGVVRTIGGAVKSFFNLNINDNYHRLMVLARMKKDPYDSYDYQVARHKKFGICPIYFFLAGNYGKFDKNISPGNKAFRNLIKSLSESSDIGLHPSFASRLNPELTAIEKQRLTTITGRNILKSRQHFLLLEFPKTYRSLIKLGIKEDFSLGYSFDMGFRASICTPYHFFDLTTETEHDFTIYPFEVMDTSLRKYLRLSPAQAIEKIEEMIVKIKRVNGVFVSLFHNESLGDTGKWKDWRKVYEKMIELAMG